MQTEGLKVLIDAREFIQGRYTGIRRVLEGLIDALAETSAFEELILAGQHAEAFPPWLKNHRKIGIEIIPAAFLPSEKALSDLTKKGVALFISPYPKLPLFGTHCSTVNIIHDVLDLTHPAYKKRTKAIFDGLRLRMALRKADLTWYVSEWSLKETKFYAGHTGKKSCVRYPGISNVFSRGTEKMKEKVLDRYSLQPGYILTLGNGLPHKNLGALLGISNRITRQFLFVGVSKNRQDYWRSRYPHAHSSWIDHVAEEDLPAIILGAFCLTQPSTAEGYGYPPLEAMACGVPAIVSDIPVLVETTSGNALVANPKKPEEWLGALDRLENRSLYRKQAEKGLKWVEPLRGRKGWQKHISDIMELLDKD